ncbi:MAG: response regulator [Deltaproteobacteria bacterium]
MDGSQLILLVEPRSTARDALATLLSDEGYEVSTADTVDEVFAEVCARVPSVVIVDLDTPGIAAAVGRLVALPHPPEVIAVTEFGRIAPALEALRDGATDYIVKPIRADELSYVLAKAIEHHELALELEQLRSELEAARPLQ